MRSGRLPHAQAQERQDGARVQAVAGDDEGSARTGGQLCEAKNGLVGGCEDAGRGDGHSFEIVV